MIGVVIALAAAIGTYYLYTALAFGWTGLHLGPPLARDPIPRQHRIERWLVHAGLEGIRVREFGAVVLGLFVLGFLLGFAVFGGIVPATLVGGATAVSPLAAYRSRRAKRRARALEAWPRMIEEIRVLTTSLGRSIPHAVFEVGQRAPAEMRPAFTTAHREWLISTDFGRTAAILKDRLADATADAAVETLLVAHELGGSDLDRRLRALTEDRIQDTQGRKDARAKQAGARFARWFVLVVPAGMAVAGMSLGNGRAAYQSPWGQAMVVTSLVLVFGCWMWASAIMRLPDEQRVFDR